MESPSYPKENDRKQQRISRKIIGKYHVSQTPKSNNNNPNLFKIYPLISKIRSRRISFLISQRFHILLYGYSYTICLAFQ